MNWAAWNPIPRKGQIRLFTWEALAHDAEVVSYFRWRQAPFAQEQIHASLNLPDNSGLSQGGVEASEVGRELARIGVLPESRRAPVALVFDYEASWILRIQPQGADFDYTALTFRWYEAVRRLGLDVDFVQPGSDLDAYQIVLVPSLPYVSDVALAAIGDTKAQVLFGPRSGSKTRHLSIPENLPPGPLAVLMPIRIREAASLRPGLEKPVNGSLSGRVSRWREVVELTGEAEAVATFADGSPAFVQAGDRHYLAGWPDAALLGQILKRLARRAGVTTQDLPDHIRMRRRGLLGFAFNYGDEAYELSGVGNIVLGASTLAPGEVTVWRLGADLSPPPPPSARGTPSAVGRHSQPFTV